MLCQQIEAKILAGEAVEAETYSNVVGAQSRTLRSLGLKRQAREITAADYVAARDREAA